MEVWTWMKCSSSSSVAVAADEAAEGMVALEVIRDSMEASEVVIHLGGNIKNKSLNRHHSSSRAQTSSS